MPTGMGAYTRIRHSRRLLEAGFASLRLLGAFLPKLRPQTADKGCITPSSNSSPGAGATRPAARRRILAGSGKWILFSGIVLAWFLSAPTRTPGHRQFGVLILTLLSLGPVIYFRRASIRTDLPPHLVRGLRWIMAGMALETVGALYVLVDAFLNPKSASPFNFSDVIFLSTYVALIGGLLCFPRAERTSIGLARYAVDAGVFIAGVGIPLWFVAVAPALPRAGGSESVMDIAYPLVTFFGIGTLNFVLLTRKPVPSRTAFRLLVVSIGVSWLADLLYLLDSVQGYFASSAVNYTNAFNAVSIGMYVLAGERMSRERIEDQPEAQPAASSPLPMMTVVVVSAWLVVFAAKGHPAAEVVSPIFWGLAILFVVLSLREMYVIRDSARWMVHEIDRKSRARSEALVRYASDLIMVVDSSLVVRFASPGSLAALGRGADALVGEPLLSLAHAEDLARGTLFLEQVSAATDTPPRLEWRLRHLDGSYRHFETVGSNLAHESAVGGLVITSRDITDRITLEERLRQSQKLEALGQLVGGIAHNFNNILTSTMMRLGLLRETRGLPPDVAAEIKALEKEAKRTASLTKKLVLVGQQQFLRKEPVNLRETIARLEPEIAAMMGKTIQFYVTGVTTPQWVEADASLLDEVILSLCANARDAMASGGCLIIEVAEREPGRPPPGGAPGGTAGPFARLSFQDTGCGMDSSVRQHLFEPFFTTKGLGSALGLGLAVVNGIVKQHQGWIEVESSPGLGSTFRVFLPRVPGPLAKYATITG